MKPLAGIAIAAAVALGSSPAAWCTSSSRDSSTGWFRRSVLRGRPPVRLLGCSRCVIC